MPEDDVRTFYDNLMQAKHDDGGTGRATREFGYSDRSTGLPVPVEVGSQTFTKPWKIGHTEHSFDWPWSPLDQSQIIVGWKIQDESGDGTNGTWSADSIIAKSSGSVHIKSDYDRGLSWTLHIFFVRKKYFPWLNSGN